MTQALRIGSQIGPYDPYWVQVREAVNQRAQQLGLELIPIEIAGRPDTLSPTEQISVVEELLAQQLDALIGWIFPESMLHPMLGRGLPIIYLSVSEVRHPLFVSRQGMYKAGYLIGEYFAKQLKGSGHVICIGGLTEEPGQEDGRSRINGFCKALSNFPEISIKHVPSYWRYEQAYPQIVEILKKIQPPIDAVFGLSDPIALAARDALQSTGWLREKTLIAGVNGDPLALVALAEGTLSATVDTSIMEFGSNAVDWAYRAAQKESLPDNFTYQQQLITAENLAEVALQKLKATAELPSRLVGVNRQLEQNRLTQMETSAAINRRVGRILNRRQLSHEIANLIRDNYGYARVQVYLWLPEEAVFMLEADDSELQERVIIPVEKSGILGEALRMNEPIFIPDTRYSHRFSPDPKQPKMRSRVVLPIRRGETVVGILDMQSKHKTLHLSHELIGLQSLADQLGIAMHNADLYEEALHAQAVAEKADQLKTRLLANVSHELRTPLNVILGYSQKALSTPNSYGIALPNELRKEINHIYRSGEHLTRLINDLLDLSRAEIDQLDLFPETIAIRPFLEEVFNSIASSSSGEVKWELSVPDRLPAVQADPVRLRQILLNLLNNASKFTPCGQIVLGASVNPPHLHFWVQDTGLGIPVDLQEQIFEPFVTDQKPGQRSEGIGLGLSITRRLVALHGGVMSLESRVGKGSTFHVYLPLPNLSGNFSAPPPELGEPVLLVLTTSQQVSQTLRDLAVERNLPLRQASTPEQIELILKDNTPSILAWDMVNARQDEWELVNYICAHPQLCLRPFIVYREALEGNIETTGMLVKPVAEKTLLEAINALRPSWGSGPILIVDDEIEMRDLYKQIVDGVLPGYPMLEAQNGNEALALMQETTPGLVILDLMMPEVDGFLVLAKMRAKSETRHVPVLVMSGKLLTMDDIQRLDYANVTFQSKELLTNEEAASLLKEILEPGETLPQPTSKLVKASIVYLHQNYTLPITREDIAEAVGVSQNYLSKIFREEVRLTPWDYLSRLRIRKAKELLDSTTDTITSIAGQVGFDDSAYFSRVFRKHTNQSPQAYREQRN